MYTPGLIVIETEPAPEQPFEIAQEYKFKFTCGLDIVAGHTAGVKTIYLGKEYICPAEYDIKPDYMTGDLMTAAKIIELHEMRNRND